MRKKEIVRTGSWSQGPLDPGEDLAPVPRTWLTSREIVKRSSLTRHGETGVQPDFGCITIAGVPTVCLTLK